jgi:hypothetical protein
MSHDKNIAIAQQLLAGLGGGQAPDTLATRIKSSGNVNHSQFAIILTVSDDTITRFQMLEDSFDLSRTVRG